MVKGDNKKDHVQIKAAELPAPSMTAGIKTQTKPIGSSGTEVFSGYFSEEYLQSLRGRRGAKIWDEMRRSEAQVAMLLGAIMNPIKSACWEFEAPDTLADSEKQLLLLNTVFKKDLDWDQFMHEALTCVPFGYSLFEAIHKVAFNHPKLGTYNGLAALGFRSQKTIERWNVEKATGKLLSVYQQIYSDVGDNTTIPAEFLVLFALHKEGDNYEGISALRPMYGAYFRKNLYLKLVAIGVEKYAVGTPVGTVPAGKEKSEDFAAFKGMLEAYTSHEASYLLVPAGWEIEIQKGDFDASEIKELIVLENTEMINAMVANFLALGTNGAGGAYALGSDLSDFFLGGIQNIANLICGVFNRKLIKDLIDLNYGPQDEYPVLKCTGINDKAGQELADIITKMISSNVIKSDDKLDAFVRKQYKLPAADEATAREKIPSGAPGPELPGSPHGPMHLEPVPAPAKIQLSERRLLLDQKYRAQFDDNKDAVKKVMQDGLRVMLDALKASLARKWKSTPAASRVSIANQVVAPGVPAYKAALREALAEVASKSLTATRKLVPHAKNLKLYESVQLAAPKGGYYDALPAKIKKIVLNEANLIGDTQAADLEKIVLFQFASSETSTESIDQILNDIEEKAGPVIEGATGSGMNVDAAASNAVANAANQTSLSFMFEPEVLDGIESFTFTNEDPISPICQELNGTTFAVGDPDLDRYSPPLHHNCKSRLVPNLKGDKGNPEIDTGGLSISRKALDSITLCEADYRIFTRSIN